ncbi:unnamed protein product [Psylliodes chrysocephalus]|uniref:BED-type domain-containing protein n=1 Tax=Psylliodes chrysocephalus TaxID=3402493 RepID=A0A9P0CTR4_9CUCU|nr:unnamed protein product [Psylliodes chrysocephala]
MSDKNKKRSDVWNYFFESGLNKAKCKFCSKILSYKGGATGNLIRHVKLVHTLLQQQEKNNKLPEDERTSTSTAPITEPSTSAEEASSLQLPRKILKPNVLSSFIKRPLNDRRTQEIHDALVKLIVKNYLPIQLVDSEYFRSFVEKLNNSYQVPSRKTVSNTLIPQLYTMVQENVRQSLENLVGCCITTDGWTSCANKSFISVTVHYIDKNNTMQSNLLDCYDYSDRHTAENLCSELKRITREWNIHNKIVAVASDNAANIVAAIRLTGWKHIPCFAHTLNLIVQSSLEENATIVQTQRKIKKIVEYFKRSTQASAKLSEMQTQLGKPILSLKQDCITRWNSTLDMFNRILQVKESLMSVIAINYPNVANIDNNDIKIIEEICNLLQVFKDVTEEMSSEKQVTASKIILLSSALKKYCANYLIENLDVPPQVIEFGQKLLDNLNTRFHLIEDNKIFAEATFLDPRFKRHGFSKETTFETTKQSLISQVTAMINGQQQNQIEINESKAVVKPEKTSIWNEFDEKVNKLVQKNNPRAAAIIEINKYVDEPIHPRKSDPLEWWVQRSHTYPRLFELTKKKLCIVATSVPSERIFSKAGLTITDRRNQLSGKRVSQILFLNANL